LEGYGQSYGLELGLMSSHLLLAGGEGMRCAECTLHCESKKGVTLAMAITLSILGAFAKFFHCCKEQ